MFGLSSRRFRRFLLFLGFLVLLLAGAGGWWVYSTRPSIRMQRGREAIRRGNWDAVESISERLQAAGESNRANLLRGEAFAARERWPDALMALNKVLDEGELQLQAALVAGRCLLELRELREANRVYTYVLTQDQDNADAHRGLAAVAYDLGNLTTALRHIEYVTHLDDADGRSYRLIGLIQGMLGDDAESEAAFREALKRNLSPEFRRQAMFELADRLVKRTRYAAALAILDERKGDGEEDIHAQVLRGEALLSLNRVEEAEKLLARAVEDYPKSAKLWALLGQLYLGRNKGSEAVHALERAVAQAPGDYQFRFQLAKAYAKVGRKEDEQKQVRQAEVLRQTLDQLSTLTREAMRKPWDVEIRLKLAGLSEKLHETKLAAMWYKAAEECKKPVE